MFSNVIPVVKTNYEELKPDLLIIIKQGKVIRACCSEKANNIKLSRILWQLSKELDRR